MLQVQFIFGGYARIIVLLGDRQAFSTLTHHHHLFSLLFLKVNTYYELRASSLVKVQLLVVLIVYITGPHRLTYFNLSNDCIFEIRKRSCEMGGRELVPVHRRKFHFI